MLYDEDVAIAEQILSDLRGTDGIFGVATLQLKYKLGYAKAARIVDYFTENGYAEKGDFGSVVCKDLLGDDIKCVLCYRIIV